MEYIGKLQKCDRCGVLLFRQAIREKETDGGYTRWTEFANSNKETWFNQKILGVAYLLCADCYQDYEQRLQRMEREYIDTANTIDDPGYIEILLNDKT